jgi:hypothetical protein
MPGRKHSHRLGRSFHSDQQLIIGGRRGGIMAICRLCAVVLICCNCVAFAQTRVKTQDALQLSIRTDRTAYRENDFMEFQMQITNYGPNSPYVWRTDLCWECTTGLKFHIITADGREIVSGTNTDLPTPPPRPGHLEAFIRIESQTFYGTITQMKVSNLFPKPGKYSFFLTYESALPAEFASWFPKDDPATKIPVRMQGDPTLVSNQLQITIEP